MPEFPACSLGLPHGSCPVSLHLPSPQTEPGSQAAPHRRPTGLCWGMGREAAGAGLHLGEDTLTWRPAACGCLLLLALLAGKQLTRGGCQRCWLLDPAAATCSLTCKPRAGLC